MSYRDKAQLAVRPQGFEVEDDTPLAEHQPGTDADEHIDVTADIDVRRVVLKAPDREVGGCRHAVPSFVEDAKIGD